MAEADFYDFGSAAPRTGRFSQLVNMAGAAATVVLIVGAAVWGYRLAVRDAHGVPVIQAMQNPMRVAPEDPGGLIANHSGLSVNRIAAAGTAGEVPDQIILAEPPLELTEEDVAGLGGATPVESASVEVDTFARTLALAEELARQAASEYAAEAEEGASTADPAVALPAGAITASVRPPSRPATRVADTAEVASITPVAAMPATVSEMAPELITAGTRLAQIGAFDDAEQARAEWARIAARHPTLFEGKSMVIQPASSVGRSFIRLRVAGFNTEDDSRRFCRAIEGGDLRCIPVTTR